MSFRNIFQSAARKSFNYKVLVINKGKYSDIETKGNRYEVKALEHMLARNLVYRYI